MAIQNNSNPTSNPCPLDWTQRPSSLQEIISNAYDLLAQKTEGKWRWNGNDKYSIGEIDELALMKKIILQAPVSQKEFYALDIGAGNFQWSKSLADFIDHQSDLPQDIKLHIIGIRGEKYQKEKLIETDRCKIYNLGAFKIEEIFNKFKPDFDLENKIDLAISCWTFRHLADPVGTFAQVFNLLRPKTGFFLVDGFLFKHKKDTLNESVESFNQRITQLFLDTKAPFLTKRNQMNMNHFILQRSNDTPCQLPMSYSSHEIVDAALWQIGSGCLTRFERETQETDKDGFKILPFDKVGGDKEMFDWLKQNELLTTDSSWQPLQDKKTNASKDTELFGKFE